MSKLKIVLLVLAVILVLTGAYFGYQYWLWKNSLAESEQAGTNNFWGVVESVGPGSFVVLTQVPKEWSSRGAPESVEKKYTVITAERTQGIRPGDQIAVLVRENIFTTDQVTAVKWTVAR